MVEDKKSEWKKKGDRALRKVIEFAQTPAIRKTSRFASSLIEISSSFKSKNPVLFGMGVVSAVEAALDSYEIPYPTKTELFARKHKLHYGSGSLPRVIIESGIEEVYPSQVTFTDGNFLIKHIEVDGLRLYFGENLDSNYPDSASKVGEAFFHDKDFPFKKLFNEIWKRNPDGVHVSLMNVKRARWEEKYLRVHPLFTDLYSYVGNMDPLEFANEIVEFRKEGTSRSYMLAGPPGTGKSSYVYEVARNLSNKIIKVDPSVAHHLTGNDLDMLLECLEPDILLLDDFDRAARCNDTMNLLFLLENIKSRFPHTVIFATVNYFEDLDKAIVRPGRFDKIIWVELPDESERVQVANKYLKENGLEYTEKQVAKIVEATDGFASVYIKELCIRLKHEGFDAVDDIVEEFCRATGDCYEEEEDNEDKVRG